MIDFTNIKGIYFVGIGGIGMSALALYFAAGGYYIAGYDRSHSYMTQKLAESDCEISYEDSENIIPDLFRNDSNKSLVLIVYTPAIPEGNRILSFFRDRGYRTYKRSEILGDISSSTDTLAVAGTHGKTTVSTMVAHLLKQSHIDCTAFLGGVSKNYDSNILLGEGHYTVMEADEFDRSFLRLNPYMAVITSLDADHLDIYGDRSTMVMAYNEFCRKIRRGGKLFVNSTIRKDIVVPEDVSCFTYGFDPTSDYHSYNIEHANEFYRFNIKTPSKIIEDLHLSFPGIINIENFTAAIAIALECGVNEHEIRKAVIMFKGVRRRFDIRVNKAGIAYVDDYAHHPEEIRVFINAIKEYFPGRRITGIFQPHLFSRTIDHAGGFAAALDKMDEVILLPIYAARENHIEGVTSELIMGKMRFAKRRILNMEDIPGELDVNKLDVLVTIGAGDIDTLVKKIEDKLNKEREC